jgi:hypothetical protein
MSEMSISQQWEQVEHQFQQIALSLAAGDGSSLLQNSRGLQRLALDFTHIPDREYVPGEVPDVLLLRMKSLAASMPQLREALHRRSAQTALALQTLVPTVQESTYAGDSAKAGGAVYGVIPRQSGTFKPLAA